MDTGFKEGFRKEAIQKAIQMVIESGGSAVIVICRDIPGDHAGGEDCFCDPRLLVIEPKEEK
jgi:hypothetical protein